jgi:hypothetical protein
VIRTLPLTSRNRLAETILRAVHDPAARGALDALAGTDAEAWLPAEERGHAPLLRERARRAGQALSAEPSLRADAPLADALAAAAALFDAGLGFEVHELLEPYWVRAAGDEREALQGLIQIAVGYQHLANGNVRGAALLLDEGSQRLAARGPAGLDVGAFVSAVRASLGRLEGSAPPRFPRPG